MGGGEGVRVQDWEKLNIHLYTRDVDRAPHVGVASESLETTCTARDWVSTKERG